MTWRPGGATDRFRFANRLVGMDRGGRRPDRRRRLRRGLRRAAWGRPPCAWDAGDATFAAVGLDDLRQPPESTGRRRARSSRPPAGAPPCPAPRHVKRPPFVRLQAPVVWTTLALTLRADGSAVVRGGRSIAVPAPLDLRRRRRPGGQGGPGRLPGLVPRRPGPPHPVGRRGHAGAGDGGGDGARTGALHPDHALGGQAQDLHAEAGRHAHRRRASRGRASCTCCSTACWPWRSTARPWPRSDPAPWWASGPSWRADGAPRPCGP